VINKQEIDLIIRAQVQNKAELQAIPKTIKTLEEALDRQAQAAQRGEASIDELKATLLSLQQAQAALTSNAGLVGAFQTLADRIQKSEERVARSTKTYDEYRKKLEGLAEVTDKQQERLIKLSTAQERANTSLSRQRESYTQMAAALKTAGIETDNLAEAEAKIRDTAAQLGIVLVKNQQAIENYGGAVRRARDEEKKRASEAAANAQAQVQAQRAIEEQQQKLLEASNRAALAAKVAKEAFAQDNALVAQADNAERAARSYTTLSRAAKDLRPNMVTLREAVDQIINPVDRTSKTLDGLTNALHQTADGIKDIKGPVKEYSTTLKSLETAQKSIQSQAGLIENFRQQTAAVRGARTEFVAAREEVRKYAEQVRQGGSSGQAFASALANAQNRARGAAEALAAQVTAAREAREALERAGISTRSLADAELRLRQNAALSVEAIKSLSNAVDQYGVAAERANKRGGIGDGERTTLNFFQRLRGQILSVTASYIGLFGAISEGKAVIDSLVGLQTINQRIAVGLDTTDPRRVGQEFDYLRSRADYYGVGLRSLADSYGSFSIASRTAGQDLKTTRFEFEQFTAGFRVMKLSTDQQNRAFTQLQQILGKTKPELEDIKTIAEAGFPAQAIMAKGLREIGVAGIKAGTEVKDMSKLMKDGLLDSQTAIYALAVGIQKELSDQVPAAVKSLQAEMGRFETAWFDFQNKVANSGFGEAFQRALVAAREFLNSPDGDRAATAIGKAFEALTNAVIVLLKNLDLVKDLSIAFLGIWAAAKFTEAINGLGNLAKGVDGVGKQLTTADKAFRAFNALLVGWTIGTILREKFAIVREAGEWLTDGLEISWKVIETSFKAMVDVLPIYFTNALKRIVNNMGSPLTAIAKGFAGIAGAIGLTGTETALNKAVQTVTFEYEDTTKVINDARARLDKDIAAIKANRQYLRTPREGVKLADGAAAFTPTAAPGRPQNTGLTDDKKAEAAAKKRATEIENITKSLEALTVRTDKAQSDSLEAQLKAVDVQYDALERRIKKLGGQEGAEFAKAFADGIASLKGQITENFNKKLMDEQLALQKKIEDAEAAGGRRSKDSLDARLNAVTQKYAQTYREIEEARKKAEQNGRDTTQMDQLKARLDAGVLEIQNLERVKFNEDQLRDKAQEVNNLLEARNNTIKSNKDLEEAGLIGQAELRDRIRATVEQTQPAIAALAAEAIKFAEGLQGAFDPAKLEQFIAKMQLATNSGKALNKEFEITQKQLSDQIGQQGLKAFNTVADAIGQAVNKQMSWSDALKATGRAALQFFADMLKWYAEAIIKQQILNSLQTGSSGSSFLKFFGALFGVGVNHEGGRVGDVNNRTRNVSPLWFANAPRYHTGGFPGLAPNEYPAILKKNEEVLTDGDPRNALNGGLNPTGAGGAPGSPTSIVLVDDRQRVPEAMSGTAGGQVIVQQIKANLPTIRSMIKGGI